MFAVQQQFKNDRSKRLVPRRQGIWVLETEDISHYLGCDHLVLNGATIANLSVKVFRIGDGGRATARNGFTDDRENDLLITLFQADTINFREVSHDDLYQKITEMGIGSMKKGITQQMYKDSDIPNGNLFFVLTDIDKDRDIDRIPHAFEFLKPGGQLRMWLNFRGKKRKCFFCNEMHDVTHCPVKERVRLMEEERKQKLAGGNGQFGVKTYGDSTVRHFCQKALASDVDAMSGGTTGNILNAIEVDEENMGIQNIVIVAGQNEMNPRHSKEEFLWMLRKKTERLVNLAEGKKVAVLAPPPQGFQDPECQIREFYFHDNLKAVTELSENVQIWKNPLPAYSNDDGRHPSQEDSIKLVKFLSDKVREAFGEELILDSASDDLLSTKNFYREVNGLYKYGCAACSNRAKNKWPLLCDDCQVVVNGKEDAEFNVALQEYDSAVERQANVMNPPLGTQSVKLPLLTDAATRDRSPMKFVGGNGGVQGLNGNNDDGKKPNLS